MTVNQRLLNVTYVEIFSSYLITECDQRAFVLKAVGIEHVVAKNDNKFVLLVPEESVALALEQLGGYEAESRPKPPPTPLQLHTNAWTGSAVYVMSMLGIAYAAGESLGGFDWYETGALRHGAIAHGELWRIVTALTLHADVGHILGNLAFGAPYGYFASQLLGTGRAWASILIAAAFANFINATLMGEQQSSIGASTAVFAMLGIVGAYAWRRGKSRFNSWAHRGAPLIAAVALLAFTGVGDERTDIVAHLAGFGVGVGMGVQQANLRTTWLNKRATQISLGLAAGLIGMGAWMWGLC